MFNNYWLKLFAVIIISTSLIFFPIYSAYSLQAILYHLKEYVLDPLGRIIARTLLSKLENKIIKKINTLGRNGGPAFVQNWRNFKQSAQYRGEDIFRAMLAKAPVCDYIKGSVDNIFGAKDTAGISSGLNRLYNLQPFGTRVRCSSTIKSAADVNAFRNDFSKGGWEAWRNLIKPQNNFYGVYAQSLSELSKQRAFTEGIDTNEATSGSGFTSARDGSGCVGKGTNRKCTILGNIVTPGKLFSKAGAATIDRELGWLTSSDELAEVIVSVITSVGNRLTNFASGGLISLPPNPANIGADTAAKDANLGPVISACINSCVGQQCGNIPTTTCDIPLENGACTGNIVFNTTAKDQCEAGAQTLCSSKCANF